MAALKRAACVVLSAALLFGGQLSWADAEKNPASRKDSKARTTAPAKAEAKTVKAAASNEELLGAIEQLKSLVVEQTRELEAQRAALREQQQKTDALERQLQQQMASVNAAHPAQELEQKPEAFKILEGQVEAMADSQKELGEKVNKVQADMTAANRANESKLRQLGNFRFSGDLRFRYEPFIQDGQTTRQRVRFRARLNLAGNITDELYGGLTFATGSLDDPISTNQTLTGFFNRKQVGFDRYFIQYTPKWLNNHATFGLGKFAFPWIRTPLTFDNDLNPEGIYVRTTWDFKNAGAFRGISLVGMWLPVFERGGSTSATTGVRADGYDGSIAGTQLQTRWKFGSRATLGLHVAAMNFINPDFIAQAQSVNPVTASLGANVTGNVPNTNTLRTNVAGNVVGYASKFLYLDTIATLGVDTGHARWPLNITFDFNNNTRATRVIQNGTAAPTGQVDNPERSAYWAELQFGRLSERKDIQFGYTFIRVERDAVITAFNESDLRAGSNLRQHRLNFSYQWLNNVSLNYTLWLGELANAQDSIALVPGGKRAVAGGPCNVSPFTGCTDNFLKRMQFDMIYRF